MTGFAFGTGLKSLFLTEIDIGNGHPGAGTDLTFSPAMA
jgi:hypothetical protein